ncbi:MAG TPA: DUF2652 domain-containing protein [Gemmatimonadales bacterium]|nr:DUF2652 domain-containing protein [Gemmatimonadales bacterium]
MTADRVIQSGFLIAADITGYTGFLVGSELDHAHDIMRSLMGKLTESLKGPLEIVEYEGDAVFCCARDGEVANASLLLDLLEQTYVAFSDFLHNMTTRTSCTCKACANMKLLDLKLFLHHGSFVDEAHGAKRDLVGADVILLHRLMKNTVRETTGLPAYLLATDAALERIGRPAGFVPHRENYEHFGDVSCAVADLKAALEERRRAREIRVLRDQATCVCEAVVPADPATVWDWFFDPQRRLTWDTTLKSLSLGHNGSGRQGVGAAMHCAHDGFTLAGTTVDWKPFAYFTQEYLREGGGFFPPPMLMTLETEALPDGRTRVVQLVRFGGNIVQRLLVAALRRSFEKQGTRDLELLAKALQQQAGGIARTGT